MELISKSLDELTEYIVSLGEPAYRAKQLYSWFHEKNVFDINLMSNLPNKIKEKLISDSKPLDFQIVKLQESADGTKKYLFRLNDSNLIESVLMHYEHGYSACISTQLGCAMACRFCASGGDGFIRNLTAGEIIGQIYAINENLGIRINHIVLMGMGEPLQNYDNVISALRILCDEKGQNISYRNITISTCGIVPGIKRLAEENIPITLALSLHASTQQKREALMPIAKKYPLNEVLSACDYYRKKTGRRVTFEYCLIKGENDSDEDILALCDIFKNKDYHLNIIPLHKVSVYEKKGEADPLNFKKKLEKKGINVTIRRELGKDIDGACGQLRMKHI